MEKKQTQLVSKYGAGNSTGTKAIFINICKKKPLEVIHRNTATKKHIIKPQNTQKMIQ